MSDIVERLRSVGNNTRRDAAHEAADTIEALRRERDAEKEKARVLRVENNTVRIDLAAMTAERDAAKEGLK